MRKWLLPLLMLGAGGIGAFFLSEKGRAALRGWLARFQSAPAALDDWNETAQLELERIQSTLNQIAQSLEPRGETGS